MMDQLMKLIGLPKVMKKNKLSKILKANISENLIKEIETVLN